MLLAQVRMRNCGQQVDLTMFLSHTENLLKISTLADLLLEVLNGRSGVRTRKSVFSINNPSDSDMGHASAKL